MMRAGLQSLGHNRFSLAHAEIRRLAARPELWPPPNEHEHLDRQREIRLPDSALTAVYVDTPQRWGWQRRWVSVVGGELIYWFGQDFLTSFPGANQTYTSDATWNNSDNTVECIGGGGRGDQWTNNGTASGRGGGGGAYSKIADFEFATPGTTQATVRVGAGGSTAQGDGGASWFNSETDPGNGSDNSKCSAAGGVGTGAGGATSAGWGETKFAGGASGTFGSFTGVATGGGGAGGPEGDGVAGTNGSANNQGTAGGAGSNGDGGPGSAGSTSGNTSPGGVREGGQVISSGGGSGGTRRNTASAHSTGAGGRYGGGSGACGNQSSGTSTSGTGGHGIVVLSWTPASPPAVGLEVVKGTYTGDGGTNRTISTGRSWTPQVVLVKRQDTTANLCVRTDTMGTDLSKLVVTGTSPTDAIRSFAAGSFNVGSNAATNASGGTYHWVALYDSAGEHLRTGQYSGNNTDNRNISIGDTWVPAFVCVNRVDSSNTVVRFRNNSGDESGTLNATQTNNQIQAVASGSFNIGTATGVNASGGTYDWFALRDVSGIVQSFAYTGNAADNRDLSSLGVTPDALVLIKSLTSTAVAASRFGTQSGDASQAINGSQTTNIIQAFITGGIQVGTASNVNSAALTYVGLALSEAEADGAQELVAALFSNSNTFGAPTVTPGAVALAPALYSDGDAFHAPTLNSSYALSAALYSDADAFFSPAIAPGAVSVAPALYSDADSFHAPTVTPGAVSVAPALYSDADAFHAPTVAATYELQAAAFSDPDSFFPPAVAASYALTPALYSDPDAFGTPAVLPGAVEVSPSLYADADAFHSPTVEGSGITLAPAPFVDPDLFHAPTVVPGAVALAPARHDDPDAFGVPTIAASNQLLPAVFEDLDIIYEPTVTGGAGVGGAHDYLIRARRRGLR